MQWGPEKRCGAIGLTFDNFGEAAELEYDLWPKEQAIGEHYTSTEVLPVMLEILREAKLSTTFFIEGWNGSVYGADLKRIRKEGHEVAFHGWRHEDWRAQTGDRRREITAESLSSLTDGESRPLGLRPPGGGITDDTTEILKQAGIKYVSPVGEGACMKGGVVSLPFRWSDVDAFYFEPFMGVAREGAYGNAELRPVAEWRTALDQLIERVFETGGCYTVIFHAYLLGQDPERMEAFRWFVNKLSMQEDLWVAPCDEIATWVLDHSEALLS